MQKISTNDTITIFGGSGFIGSHIVKQLADTGAKIKIVSRNPEPNYPLKVCGSVGQIAYSKGDVTSFKDVERNIRGSNHVINLIGILYEKGKQNFQALHIDAARNIALSCVNNNVKRLIHFSALGVDRNFTSKYANSKRAGEQQIRQTFPNAVILRPSVVFGAEDNFINMFANLIRVSPILPLIGGGKTKFQPVYVEDVAKAVKNCLIQDNLEGKVLELGGPQIYTLREVFQLICSLLHKKRVFINVPFGLAKMQALFFELLPHPLLTRDQVELLKTDNILSNKNDLKELGVKPTLMEAIINEYLQ